MKQEIAEWSEEDEDELFDLNEEPIERKRKRVEISPEKENENVSGLSTEVTGRVLSSRTTSMTDGENQAIEGEIVKMEEDDACEASVQSNKKKRRRRNPKGRNESLDMVVKNKRVKINGGEGRTGNMGELKRLKVNGSGNGSIRPEKKTVEGKEMGLREQKKLMKEHIVDMLYKAGWTIQYKERQSREYKDAIYVDREGRGYWSVTLAYKKLKDRIDKGEATERDISAFTPIPEDKLSLLFRVTTIGMKSRKNKNSAGKSNKKVTKKETSKIKSVDGRTKARTRQTLLARRAGDGSDMDGYELYEGKRSLLSWMIDLGIVPVGGKVRYKKGRTKKMVFYGKIVKDGICCDCCNITHSVQDFESHAKSDLGKPYQNTYLESGNTLSQCLLDSWKKHVEINRIGFVHVDVDGDDPNDDTCNICGDGGNLICCDSCPSTFHHGCLHINIPSGDWHCVYCSCKFCGMAGENTSMSDNSHDSLSDLFTCRLCEEKFHVNCIKVKVAEVFDQEDEDPSFCGNECQKIFEQLQVLLGVRHELEQGFFYTVLQHREVSSETSSLNDEYSKVESNAKLAVAFSVMDECFEPIIDERSDTNMIHSVVHNRGSNIRRLNYGGFYTIILEKVDEIIAAASIRIHGGQLAEMPFIGTRFVYRHQGMCSRLLTSIETVLSSLGIEKLVIPAISELNETWTKRFSFYPLEESKRQEMKHMSMIVFPKTNMLQKPLIAHRSIKTESNSNTSPDVKKMEIGNCVEAAEIERDQNTQEKQNEDTGGLATSSIAYVASKVQIHDNDKANEVDLDDKKSDAKFSTVNLGVSSENGNLLGNLNDNDTSVEVKVHDNDKVDGVDLGDKKSDHKISPANPEASSENGKFHNKLNDNDISVEVNTGIDCNVESVQCVEGSSDCVNGLLSVISNGKSSDVDMSGVKGEEEEGKIERQGCCISKKQVMC